MKTALTASELAELGLPGLVPGEPDLIITTERGVRTRAKADTWPHTDRPGRGGGRLYPVATLPGPWRAALLQALVQAVPRVCQVMSTAWTSAVSTPEPVTPTPPAKRPEPMPDPCSTPAAPRRHGGVVARCGQRKMVLRAPAGATSDRQRSVGDARAALLAEVDRLSALMGVKASVHQLCAQARAGSLPPRLQALVAVANDRSNGSRALSPSTVWLWRAMAKAEGGDGLVPAPTATVDLEIPDWAPAIMQLWAVPSNPTLAAVLRDLPAALPSGLSPPSESQARRFLSKIAPYARERGRSGPNALKAYRACTRRDTSELWPTAVYIADGHTFRARVLHPVTGTPMMPEITTVLDVVSRAAVGWSIGLSENSIGVLEALSAAMAPAEGAPGGIPVIFYTDLGKGFKNEMMSAQATGFYARWSIREEHSIARNSQARGIIERFHQFYHALAKQFSTFCGDDMDKDAVRLIDQANSKALTRGEVMPIAVTWTEFRDRLMAAIATYNGTPHDGLPRLQDPLTGRQRHLSPLEAWDAGVTASGYKPQVVVGDGLLELQRPVELRRVARCEIKILSGIYFSRDLEAWHGQMVQVAYELRDASQVYVRDLAGRPICTANFGGNSRPYFDVAAVGEARGRQESHLAPRSLVEKIGDRRTKGQLARLDEKRSEVLAAARPQLDLVAAPAPLELSPEQREAAEAMRARIEARKAPAAAAPVLDVGGRPAQFGDDLDLIKWVSANPEAATAADLGLIKTLLAKGSFKLRLSASGVNVEHLRQMFG